MDDRGLRQVGDGWSSLDLRRLLLRGKILRNNLRLDRNRGGLNLNRNSLDLLKRLLLILQWNNDRNILDIGLLLTGNILGVVDDLRFVHRGGLLFVYDCCGLLVTLRLLDDDIGCLLNHLLGLIHNILLLINNLLRLLLLVS